MIAFRLELVYATNCGGHFNGSDMKEQNDIGEAQVSAQAFFDEMLVWELWSLKVWDDEEKDDERRENL